MSAVLDHTRGRARISCALDGRLSHSFEQSSEHLRVVVATESADESDGNVSMFTYYEPGGEASNLARRQPFIDPV